MAERIVTKSDLDEALRPIYARFDALDARFDAMAGSTDARFDAIDARFDAMAGSTDARFDAIDDRFDAMAGSTDARFDALDARFDAMAGSTDARFDALDAKIDSVHRELSGKFNILLGVMALGFTLLTGLGGYNAISPHYVKPTTAVPVAHEQAAELHGAPPPQPPAGN